MDRDDRPDQAAAPRSTVHGGHCSVTRSGSAPSRHGSTSEENNSITGYQILRGPDADSLAVIEDDTGSTSTSYTDETPPAGQTHTYGVKAHNASGLSPSISSPRPCRRRSHSYAAAWKTAKTTGLLGASHTCSCRLPLIPSTGLQPGLTRKWTLVLDPAKRRPEAGMRRPSAPPTTRTEPRPSSTSTASVIRFLRISHREPRGKPPGRHRECRQQRGAWQCPVHTDIGHDHIEPTHRRRPRVHVQRASRRHPDVWRHLLAHFRSSTRFQLL